MEVLRLMWGRFPTGLTRLVYFPDENHWVLKPQDALVWHREVFGWPERYIGRDPTG